MYSTSRKVSTHSRPKAAGYMARAWLFACMSFNTQPPEGGWKSAAIRIYAYCCFNTQPPEGGWVISVSGFRLKHSFNTQPPEGGWRRYCDGFVRLEVSTHSRPKAAGIATILRLRWDASFQHTAARRRLGLQLYNRALGYGFNTQPPEGGWARL